MWADVDPICDLLVDESHGWASDEREVFKEFKKYLAYKGRGIPRRIIRTLNEYVGWNGEQLALVFRRQDLRKLRFFAGLQEVLAAHESVLFGESHEEVQGTHSDKRRLGVYYLIDWILHRGAAEFTLKDLLSASKRLSVKIALAEEIAPRVADDIIRVLLEADFIQELPKALDRVFIGDAKAIDEGNLVEEKRYKLPPRRLVELGGLAADLEVDPDFNLPADTLSAERARPMTAIGKYRIVRVISQGGMGVVYEAIDGHTGRKVAVKVIADVRNTELAVRFEREALIMNDLNHPNIVRLYDWGKEGDRPYIVMEYLDGLTLEEVLRIQGKLDLSLAIAVASALAEAAHYVHQKGYVRNDIKPSNVMLTSAGRVCWFDFGTTKPAGPNAELLSKFDTKAGGFIGTPLFAAPE